MKYYSTLDDTATFLQKNAKLIEGVKVTRLDVGQFNNMEGYQYDFNLKVTTVDGYKNKLINVHTNSSWVQDLYEYDDDGNRTDTKQDDKKILTDYLNNQLF